jgi:guanylate kinase
MVEMLTHTPSVNLLMGPSGVGKSTIIKHLMELGRDSYAYPKFYTTRAPRIGESNKVSITLDQYDQMKLNGNLVVNDLYEAKFALSKEELKTLLDQGASPLIDWALEAASGFNGLDYRIRKIYIAPMSIEEWVKRATKAGRDGERLKNGLKELENLFKANFSHPNIDYVVINADNAALSVATSLHKLFTS